MPPSKVRIVRPNGTVFDGTVEELTNLQFLDKGYHAETPEELFDRKAEDAASEHYGSGFQQFATGVEGTANGVTLGLSEIGADDESAKRAKYNPGTRLATEIGGAIGGSLLGVGPAGLLTEGATAAQTAAGGFKGAVLGGAIEGAGAGLQSTMSQSTLTGDPLTAGSIVAGIGYGGLFGGSLGGTFNLVGHGLEKLGNKLEVHPDIDIPFYKSTELKTKIPATFEDIETKTSTREIRDLIKPIHEDSFNSLRKTINDFSTEGSKLGENLSKAVDDAADNYSMSFAGRTSQDMTSTLANLQSAANDVGGNAFLMSVAQKEVGVMRTVAASAKKAVDAGDFAKASEALERYSQAIKKVASITGSSVDMPLIPGVIDRTPLQAAIKSAGRAFETQAAARTLADFPTTVEGFMKMKPSRAEKMFAALENALKDPSDELSSFKAALQSDVERVITSSGVQSEGNVIDQLHELYKFAKKTPTDDIITTIEDSIKKDRSKQVMLDASHEVDVPIRQRGGKTGGGKSLHQEFGEHIIAKGVGSTVGYAVAGPIGGLAGYWGARGLMSSGSLEGLNGLKNAVQNRISNAAKKAGKALQSREANYIAAKAQPMYYRIDGTYDDKAKKKDYKSLARDRITEITDAAPAAKNILYKAVEPLVGGHTDLAAAIQNSALMGFNAFLDMIPKDPGVARSNMKSLWKPNDVQAVQFNKMYEAFMFPVGVIEDVLSDVSSIDPIKVNTIKAVHPDLYQYMRGLALENMDFENMDYRTQGKVSILLDIDIHSSFSPMSIAESQRQFMELPQVPESGGNRGGTPGNAGGPRGNGEPPTLGQSLSRGA